jgi:type 1 glutamine amidotransferase
MAVLGPALALALVGCGGDEPTASVSADRVAADRVSAEAASALPSSTTGTTGSGASTSGSSPTPGSDAATVTSGPGATPTGAEPDEATADSSGAASAEGRSADGPSSDAASSSASATIVVSTDTPSNPSSAITSPAITSPAPSPSSTAPPPTARSSSPSSSSTPSSTGPATTGGPPTVLVFSRTAGYRHPSIVDGVAALSSVARGLGYQVVASEDPSRFTDGELSRYAAVVFLSTSGDVLDDRQQAAFERYIEGGGGYVGVHAASDTEYGWPWYGRLVGAWFADHPLVPNAEFVDCHCYRAEVVRRATHPSTDHLPPVWTRRDEWYNFRSPPPASATILLTVDEATYPGGTMGTIHPVTWAQTIGRGRSWYTAMGHTSASFAEPDFRRHLAGGLSWVAG